MAVTLRYESLVKCTPARVWEHFHDVSQWKRFNPAINDVKWTKGEPWTVGSQLSMELVQPRPMTVHSELAELHVPRFLRLKGKMMGVSADHSFEFTDLGDGTTRMRTVQVLTGPATIFISKRIQDLATATFVQWFETLRREIEC
ncbi:MAG: SRPBCC family protein [Acidobacteriaceae bacterium]